MSQMISPGHLILNTGDTHHHQDFVIFGQNPQETLHLTGPGWEVSVKDGDFSHSGGTWEAHCDHKISGTISNHMTGENIEFQNLAKILMLG